MTELLPTPPALEWERIGTRYRDHADGLRRYVRQVTASRGLSESLVDAEGIVHEAFLSMVGSAEAVQDPPAWLRTVARRLVSKVAAQHVRRQADGDPHDLLHTGGTRWSSLTPRASAEDVYEARRVLNAISTLPDNQQKAVYLRHVLGWTQAEIGDYLACEPSTAGVHIHRGTARLRQNLGKGWVVLAIVGAVTYVIDLVHGKPTPPPPPMSPPEGLPPAASGDLLGSLIDLLGPGVLGTVVGVLAVVAVVAGVWGRLRR